ncbi:hypothetical protein I8H83_05530 [Candidatus Saccharibacteria bacterium]|nr:hypothetical protein [Candidatus Saccharibacteria bacterium]MBH2008034.1 hypothetical protein [Candidatus Saccharibacteria bacterium]
MDSTVLAVRAITASYGRQLLWPTLIVLVALYIIIFGLSWWLAAVFHPLWWLLVLMLTPLFIVGCLAWGLCFFLISRIHPKLNKTQTKLTREIVGHITHIAEQVGTPKFIILGRIVRDVVFGTNLRTSYIGEITHEPGDAKRKFDELRKSL